MQEALFPTPTPAAHDGPMVSVAQTPTHDLLVRLAMRMNPNYPRLPAYIQQAMLADMQVVYGEVVGTPNETPLGTYVPRESVVSYGYADLQDLKERLLAPREIVRDEEGYLYHHELPVLDESVRVDQFLAAFGIESEFVCMETDCPNDPRVDQYFEGEVNFSWWEPTPPDGEGWQLCEIYDTENGVYAMFVRSQPVKVKVSRRVRLPVSEGATDVSLDLGFPNTTPGVVQFTQESGEQGPVVEPCDVKAVTHESQGPCLCQEDIGHSAGTCRWVNGKRPCEQDSSQVSGV